MIVFGANVPSIFCEQRAARFHNYVIVQPGKFLAFYIRL